MCKGFYRLLNEDFIKDQSFPLIEYPLSFDPYSCGLFHGETFREGIKELASIRKELMIKKNPAIKESIPLLAKEGYQLSKEYNADLTSELEGIAKGSNLSIEDIIVLNNYTDFRDISLPQEGCSTVHMQQNGQVFSGQTWDMHSSAKNYICLLKNSEGLFFSLVGCLGLMGVNTSGHLIGVNNLNTTNARSGILWPLLVRQVLQEDSLSSMKIALLSAPVTGGHNYMISSPYGGAHVEVTPTKRAEVSHLDYGREGVIFHTNHCLDPNTKALEDISSLNSTTHIRYELLNKKVPLIKNFDDFINLFRDHENYPKSLCSHFESGLQDPSMTCGGGACNLTKKHFIFWRGCPGYDDNFKEISFTLNEGVFKKE